MTNKQDNILYLEKRGCDFTKDTPEDRYSDVNNYRVGSYDYTIKGKNGINYILEFTLWRNKGHYRTTTKNGKRQLKHPVFEIDEPLGMHLDTEFENENGSWSDLKLEQKFNSKNIKYTLKNILKVVNKISEKQYTKIIFKD